MNVLVVDDDSMVMRTLQKLLDVKGISHTATNNGEDAISIAKTLKFDLAILDIRMPGMKGTEAADRIEEETGTKCKLMTGFFEEKPKRECLMKPFGLDEFLSFLTI